MKLFTPLCHLFSYSEISCLFIWVNEYNLPEEGCQNELSSHYLIEKKIIHIFLNKRISFYTQINFIFIIKCLSKRHLFTSPRSHFVVMRIVDGDKRRRIMYISPCFLETVGCFEKHDTLRTYPAKHPLWYKKRLSELKKKAGWENMISYFSSAYFYCRHCQQLFSLPRESASIFWNSRK